MCQFNTSALAACTFLAKRAPVPLLCPFIGSVCPRKLLALCRVLAVLDPELHLALHHHCVTSRLYLCVKELEISVRRDYG